MKRVIQSLAALSLLLLITGLYVSDVAAQETRDLSTFTGIGIGISADVYYTPGDSHEIKIEGDSKDVEDLKTWVENGMLKMKFEDWRIKRSKLTIYITSKDLDKVSLSGSGKFISDKAITSEEMSLAVSGSGNIQFAMLTVEEMDVKISGSGNAHIDKGTAEEVDVKISGSGKFLAEAFEVSEFSGAISGSGSIKITVIEELEARISGSGSVHYHGDPQINSTSSGSGKVRSL
jgi:hypothetical protein